MRAIAVYPGEEKPQCIEIPRPTPTSGEALIRTLRVGIDGTDYGVIKGEHGGIPDGEKYHILGHEAVGVVVDPNGTSLNEGDVVVPTVRRPPGESNRYFENNEPDMAPAGSYVERGIAGGHGYMAEYFTSPEQYLIDVPDRMAAHGFLIEPISNSEKAFEHAAAARAAFEWDPETALVLGNGPLGLLTLAILQSEYKRTYCLGRRDRPDPTIDIIEQLGATYVDSRETPVPSIPDEYESVDFAYEATGYAKHAVEVIESLSANGVAALLGIPEDWTFDVNGGKLHREMVLENKALLGCVNSNVHHFKRAKSSLTSLPDWFLDALITDVYTPDEVTAAFQTDPDSIKTVVEFATHEDIR